MSDLALTRAQLSYQSFNKIPTPAIIADFGFPTKLTSFPANSLPSIISAQKLTSQSHESTTTVSIHH